MSIGRFIEMKPEEKQPVWKIIRDNCVTVVNHLRLRPQERRQLLKMPNYKTVSDMRKLFAKPTWPKELGLLVASRLGIPEDVVTSSDPVVIGEFLNTLPQPPEIVVPDLPRQPRLIQPTVKPFVLEPGKRYIREPYTRETVEMTDANTPWFLRSPDESNPAAEYYELLAAASETALPDVTEFVAKRKERHRQYGDGSEFPRESPYL